MSNNVNNPSDTMLGKGIPFDRIRRVTGYLTGSLDRWNSGKRAEEHDRVKHGLTNDTSRFDSAKL